MVGPCEKGRLTKTAHRSSKQQSLENRVLGPYHWSRNLLGEHLADATDLGPDTA